MILVPDLTSIETSAVSNAERLVARLLAEISEMPNAVAFYSTKLRSHPHMPMAEADFIVVWDGIVIVIEVKGGGVRKHNGVWYSVDRHGDWHQLRTSPMEQARSAMFALRDILKEDGLGWYPDDSAVITPDIDTVPNSVEWRPSRWLTKNNMSVDGLVRAFNSIAADRRRAPQGRRVALESDVRTRLFGEFTRMPVIDALRGVVVDEQNRATVGQARVLALLSRNQRLMVLGGAGTGKSLVLVEGAKQESATGRSVLITFHSSELMKFFLPQLQGHTIDVIPFAELVEGKTYDSVFVDEGQDLMTDQHMDRLDRAIEGGRSSGRWRMFLDPNNQAHVDGGFDQETYELVADDAVRVDLELNVRNTRAIVHVVQSYLGADIGDPAIVAGESVDWCYYNEGDSREHASVMARDLISKGVRKSDIWIIPASSEAEPFYTSDGIAVITPRFAKGLEAEHVIVCDLPSELDDVGLSSLYVAVTRPRVALHIMVSRAEKRRLEAFSRELLRTFHTGSTA